MNYAVNLINGSVRSIQAQVETVKSDTYSYRGFLPGNGNRRFCPPYRTADSGAESQESREIQGFADLGFFPSAWAPTRSGKGANHGFLGTLGNRRHEPSKRRFGGGAKSGG